MTRDLDKLRRLQAEAGHLTPEWVSRALGISRITARSRCYYMHKIGLIERIHHGAYRLAEDRRPAPVAADGDPLIGVPMPTGIAAATLDRALAALLQVGRSLSAMYDESDHEAAAEWIAGAMREQSRQGAILRLMVEMSKEDGR